MEPTGKGRRALLLGLDGPAPRRLPQRSQLAHLPHRAPFATHGAHSEQRHSDYRKDNRQDSSQPHMPIPKCFMPGTLPTCTPLNGYRVPAFLGAWDRTIGSMDAYASSLTAAASQRCIVWGVGLARYPANLRPCL